jgi:hypothetical protein
VLVGLREGLFGQEAHQIGFHHPDYHLFKGYRGFPTQLGACLGGIANQEVDLSRAEEAGVGADMGLVVESQVCKCYLARFADAMGLTRSHDIVAGLVLL